MQWVLTRGAQAAGGLGALDPRRGLTPGSAAPRYSRPEGSGVGVLETRLQQPGLIGEQRGSKEKGGALQVGGTGEWVSESRMEE